MEEFFLSIIGFFFLIAVLLLYVFLTGVLGAVIAWIFGLRRFVIFDIDDANGLVATGFWLQWQFWVCVFIGTAHIYTAFLISNSYSELFAYAYFFSIFPLMFVKIKILDLLDKWLNK